MVEESSRDQLTIELEVLLPSCDVLCNRKVTWIQAQAGHALRIAYLSFLPRSINYALRWDYSVDPTKLLRKGES